MKQIAAVFVAAAAVLSACNDRRPPQDVVGPTGSLQSEAVGTQVATDGMSLILRGTVVNPGGGKKKRR